MNRHVFITFGLIYVLPHCISQGCNLENGIAIREGRDSYIFKCNHGYKLIGLPKGKCDSFLSLHTRCVSKCWPSCVDISRRYMKSCQKCPNDMVTNWKCLPMGIPGYSCMCRKISVFNPGYMNITYSSQEDQNAFPVGTIATYSCSFPHAHKGNHLIAKCTDQGWSSRRVPSCVCHPLFSEFQEYKYTQPRLANGYYPIGTLAHFTCSEGYAPISPTYPWKCTVYGWENSPSSPGCVLKPTTTKAPVAITATIHNHHNNEMVIVSATIGTTMAVLIVLVVVVTCQRRLHYHRIRRARLRCCQDRDAFSAYITYHHNVGMILPSYDEACRQHQHGEPPTFDEAVATSARQPSDPLPSPPSAEDGESVVVRPSTSTEDVSQEGHVLQRLRMFFGRMGLGRGETTYSVYAQITSNTSNESLNTQESIVVDNNTQESMIDINTQTTLPNNDGELNIVLSQAGLC